MVELDATHNPDPRRRRIFLIDDDVGFRRSLQLRLIAAGYDVRAYGEAAAVAGADLSDTDCLIVDYRMPASDGIVLLEHLRRRGFQAPSILITGFYTAELDRSAREAGFEAVLQKPLDIFALQSAMSELLTSKS